MEAPTKKEDFGVIEKEHMDTAQQAMTEVREKLWSSLSPEQKKLAMGSHLKIQTTTKENSTRERIYISGTVEIDGEKHEVSFDVLVDMLDKLNMGNNQLTNPFAKIDGIDYDSQDSADLFRFYYPIAKITSESEHYPTEDSQMALKKNLASKLLGR